MLSKRTYLAVGAIALIAAAVILEARSAKAGPWTGCYGGVHGGYTAALHDMSVNGPTGPTTTGEWLGLDGLGGSDFSYGGMAGCDVEVAPKIVLGVVGDYTWDDASFHVTLSCGLGAPAPPSSYL